MIITKTPPKILLNKIHNGNFLALITRCKNEPYVTEFVNYYLNQGVDKIYIIDDNSDNDIYKEVLNISNVKIIFNKNFIIKHNDINKRFGQFYGCNKLYKKIKNKYEWIIVVDMDEYITTRKHITSTIREELETTFIDSMCIKIPWVMMASNSIKKNPKSLLKTNIYRWNHNNKHINTETHLNKFRCRYNNIEVKCIFKPKYFKNIFMHHPLHPISKNVIIVDGIYNRKANLDPFYQNLRENNIQEGYLLCYHYRIVSIENCVNKINNNILYKHFKLTDLLSTDYPEIIDNTLKTKS